MLHPRASRAAILVPVVLLAACGSSGGGKAQYVSKAEAICKDANTKVKALTVPSSPDQLPAYISSVIAIAGDATTKLGALSPPSKDEANLDAKVLAPLRAQLAAAAAYLTEFKAAVAAHDSNKETQLALNPPTQTKADLDFMKSYGFHACLDAVKPGG